MKSKLFSEELVKELNIPELYSQEDEENPMAYVKFFDICSNWTWYVLECQKQEDGDYLFFGYVMGLENELGYFSLAELESVNSSFPRIERDLYFNPTELSNIKKKHQE
ncbi:MAG: DUF2958 domain-containing protein [Marinisporobacter sp.]|jgi:hypothetical protein|nr:DUF2958 domain-containing protein [Marinisporobacter sp.]